MRIGTWIGRVSRGFGGIVVVGSVATISIARVSITEAAPVAASIAPGDEARAEYSKVVRGAAELLAKGDLDSAEKALDSADLALRGFEWRHLHLSIELARGATAGLSTRATGRAHLESNAPKTAPVTILRGHVDACSSVAFSPLGDRIATCSLDRSIRLWSARSGDLLRVLGGHEAAVVAIAFSPDGTRLLSASDDGSARIWDATSGESLLVLRAGSSAVTAIAWSRDGSLLATASADRAIRVWPASASEARIALRGHEQKITSIAFSKDGATLVSGSEDRTVREWNLATGDCARIHREAGLEVTAVAFSPSGEQFAATSLDTRLRVWDLASGTLANTILGQAEARALAFSHDGKRIVTADSEGRVRVIDALSGLPLLILRAHEGAVRAVAFSPNDDRLATCGDDKTVRIHETLANVARAAQRESVVDLPTVEDAAKSKPLEVDALCARVVQRPGLEARMYEDAETLSRATLERLPESGQIHTTLGGAQYRLEKYTEALETLTLAGEQKKGWPANLAFRAMTLAQLDRLDEAKAMLARLATLVKEERWSQDVEAAALLEETRNVVAAKTPAKK